MTIEEWLLSSFTDDSRPNFKKVVRWCREDKIPPELGKPVKLGNQWLIYPPSKEDNKKPIGHIQLTGNDPVVDSILMESVR
jgi:hypothetical protein